MKCPNCGKEGCKYTDRKISVETIKGKEITKIERKRAKSVDTKVRREGGRKHNKVRCNKCKWEGEIGNGESNDSAV